MKNNVKRIMSIILSILMLFAFASFGFGEYSGENKLNDAYFDLGYWSKGNAEVNLMPQIYNFAFDANLFEGLFPTSGSEIPPENYSVGQYTGFVKIIFHEDYLNTLSVGKHIFTAVFKNAEVSLSIYVCCGRQGDLNGDGRITSSDARDCLRAAAKLEELTPRQALSADVFGDNKINASCARKILRVAAKTDTFDTPAYNMYTFEDYTVGSLYTSSDGTRKWSCEVNRSNDIDIKEISPINASADDKMTEQLFELSPNLQEDCDYEVVFKLINMTDGKVIDEFRIVLKVIVPRGGLIWDDWETISEHLTDID